MSDPVAILKSRLASGEVTVDEYKELLSLLVETVVPHEEAAKIDSELKLTDDASDKLLIGYNDKLWLHEGYLRYFAFGDEKVPYNKISHIRANFMTYKLNLVPIHKSADFTFGIGGTPFESESTKWVKIVSDQAKFLRSSEQHALVQCYSLIANRSMENRRKYYLDSYRKNNYLDIGPARLYSDAILENKASGKRLDLRLAKHKGEISLGVIYGAGLTSQSDPNQIYFLEEKKFFGKNEMIVSVFNNADVVMPLVSSIIAKF